MNPSDLPPRDLLRAAWDSFLRGNVDTASALADEALQRFPTSRTFSSVGLMCMALGQYEQAESLLARAIKLDPTDAESLYNCAHTLIDQRKIETAIAIIDLAVNLKPDSFRIRWLQFTALYLSGQFARALEVFEFRHKFLLFLGLQHIEPLLSRAPIWDGAPGQRLLLVQEQGLGDTIQYIRFVESVRKISEEVNVFVAPSLESLIQRCVGNVVTMTTINPESFDAWCPLMSLPFRLRLFAPTDAPSEPYLNAPQRQPIPTHHGFPKIGLAWKGSSSHPNDGIRSMDVTLLEPLAKTGAAFFSLTVGSSCPSWIVDCGPLLRNLDDTAAVIAQLDLVISVDTAVAHLAGALGKPVWIMIPSSPDWRWGLHGDTTAWYPSARLYRQLAPRRWEPVVNRVIDDIQKFVTSLI